MGYAGEPDITIALGVGRHPRNSYKIRVDGRPPDLVVEALSCARTLAGCPAQVRNERPKLSGHVDDLVESGVYVARKRPRDRDSADR